MVRPAGHVRRRRLAWAAMGTKQGNCDEGARCAGVAGLIEPSANQLPALTLRMAYLNVRLTELSLLVDKT